MKALKGKVKLVKMNIDEHPAIPGQMGIQSIPAVIAFVNGKPADGFLGALPEGQVIAFLERLTKQEIGGEDKELLKEADAALAAGNAAGAAAIYAEILTETPDNLAALAGLARSYLETGEIEQAKLDARPGARGQAQRGPGRRGPRRAGGGRAGRCARPDRRAGEEGRRQSARPSGALRSGARAQRRITSARRRSIS